MKIFKSMLFKTICLMECKILQLSIRWEIWIYIHYCMRSLSLTLRNHIWDPKKEFFEFFSASACLRSKEIKIFYCMTYNASEVFSHVPELMPLHCISLMRPLLILVHYLDCLYFPVLYPVLL